MQLQSKWLNNAEVELRISSAIEAKNDVDLMKSAFIYLLKSATYRDTIVFTTMAKLKYTILVIDDDPSVIQSIVEVLEPLYEKVIPETDLDQAMEDIELMRPDLILLDVFPGSMNSLDYLEKLHERGIKSPVILLTGFADIKIGLRAVRLGADDFVAKPIDAGQLEFAVKRALRNYDMRRQMDVLQERLSEEEGTSEMLGNSDMLKQIKQFADIFAQSDDTTVLILGESGTGKELMARYIHNKSPRAHSPFISVNCGAIPRELAENELFGYERGAFTGATEKLKLGRFEMAHRGTIMLDEIGELSLEMQVKLLRVLQEKRFYRLGGTKEVAVDVRVIAATNRNLEKMIEEGKFREDLYYRLNVGTITVPPLRERKEDILLLATTFLKEFSKKFGKQIDGFTPEAQDILRSYEWKGNIREMRNVIERITLLEQGTMITRESLKFLRPGSTSSQGGSSLASGQHQLIISAQGAPLENVMRDLIQQTLRLAGGNHTQAAKMLGLTRAVLNSRIEQLGINASFADA
jgi:DNA-binding NtrC family response regulator